jgi:hypothetical protein
VFYIGIVNIDQDVAHVAVAIHIGFKCMFRLFHLYVASISLDTAKINLDVAYIGMVASVFRCFQLLHTYVSRVSSGCCIYFAMVVHVFLSDICFKCFIRILYIFCNGCTCVSLVF